ncbi:hypothetical protein BN133_2397 [Cronobacter dublinensis 582]|nr:hypothetical protein BN133_2397 [Cronobacter dublinensis 582]
MRQINAMVSRAPDPSGAARRLRWPLSVTQGPGRELLVF